MESVDVVVIGAGVVGLAIARELAQAGREVLVLESEDDIGTGVSSRHSSVVHAGIYYPANSLKARLCVAGRHALVQYCRERAVALGVCGKLIVGDVSDRAALHTLLTRGHQNGVDDLRLLNGAQARAMESELSCDVALYSPSTGIVDSHELMQAFAGDIENAGGTVVCRTPVTRGQPAPDGLLIHTGGAEPTALHARLVVNAAGLNAVKVAHRFDGTGPLPRLYLAKGNYFDLSGRPPFRHLVYPAPAPGGLGIHLTLDLAGRARFGPDVEWVERLDYEVDPQRAGAFYSAIRRYWPGLPDGALYPAYAGIRPKLVAEGQPAADFRIDDDRVHGVTGLINLLGIESPGLTSSMAIAKFVAGLPAVTQSG